MGTPQKVTTSYKNKGGYNEKVEPRHNAERREQNRRLRDEQSTSLQKVSRGASHVGSAVSGAFGTAFGAVRGFNDKVQARHKNNPMVHGKGMGFGDIMSMKNPFEPQRETRAPARKKRRKPPMQNMGGFNFVEHMNRTPWD
jgi:hypothetical protein